MENVHEALRVATIGHAPVLRSIGVLVRRALAVVLACLVLAVSACRPGPGAEGVAHPVPEITELAVPAAFGPPASTVRDAGLVAPAGALPALLVGSRVEPGGLPRPGVWTLADDGVAPVSVDPGVPGAVVAVRAAGSAELTAVAGYTWRDGRHHAFVLTSTDRSTWTPVALPESAAHLRPEVVAVDGTVVRVAARDDDGGTWVVTLAGDDDATVTALPSGEDEDGPDLRVSPVGMVARGEQVVVVAAHEVPARTLHRAHLSTDGGRTWAAVVLDPDDRVDVDDVVATAGGWVAVGSAPAGSSGPLRPAAWRSDDGAYWVQEDVVPDALDADVAEDAWLTAADAAGDAVAAVLLVEESRAAHLVERTPEGEWYVVADAAGLPVRGLVDHAASPAADLARRPDGTLDVALASAGTVRVDRVAADAAWAEGEELGSPFRAYEPHVPEHRDGTLSVPLVRERFRPSGTGWTRTSELTLAQVGADGLEQVTWEPEVARGAVRVVRASAPDGTQVVLAGHLVDRAVEVRGSMRRTGGSGWQDVTGFVTGRLDELTGLAWTERGWVAVGRTGADLGDDDRRAALWASDDGVAWDVRDDVEWPDGTRLHAVCRAPDGGAVVVGDRTDPNGGDETVAAAWLVDAEGTVEVTGLDGEGGVWACVDDGDRTVLVGTLDDRSTLWTLDQGRTEVTVVHRADRADTLGTPVAVDGGWVAWGRVEGTPRTGPVLWLSRNLATWWPVPVPSPLGTTHGVVARDGGDVVAVAGTLTGVRAWRVTGVTDALRAGPPDA